MEAELSTVSPAAIQRDADGARTFSAWAAMFVRYSGVRTMVTIRINPKTRNTTLLSAQIWCSARSKKPRVTGASAAMTASTPIATMPRVYATSKGSVGPPLRTAMSAPKPTNTPAIPASSMNSSVTCMSRTSSPNIVIGVRMGAT